MSYRNCCWTLNNYNDEDVETIKNWDCKYLIFGREIGENETPHLQGYVEWKSSKKFSTLKNLHNKIHWEKRMGSPSEAANYCKKQDKNYFEKGIISSQGERTDLNEIKESILNGKKVDEIALEKPIIYHQYGRTLNKIEDLVMRKNHRKNITKGMWIYGSTGTGKSTKAYENYDESTHFDLINDRGWWDGYHQQENVIINDFRGWIDYDMLLKIVDWTPLKVPRRGREPMPFTSKFVYITSSLHPKDVYCNRHDRDSIEQLYRRFRIVKIEKCYETIEHEPTDERFHWG